MDSTVSIDSVCREFLAAHQNSDGGWGFHPGAPSAVEATAWTLLALQTQSQTAGDAEVCSRSRKWLLRAQLADGSWPAYPGQEQGCWVTSLAVRVLHAYREVDAAVNRGLDWVLNAWPAEGGLWWRIKNSVYRNKDSKQDSSLRGWNWTPGTASWVEPTAHALLLLNALAKETLPPLAAERRNVAERMLFDRMCPGGGWNSGNPQIYGVAGIPRIGPTVWALMALRRHAERAEVRKSLATLEADYGKIPGAGSLALAAMCLSTYERPVSDLAARLNELYSHHQFFDNVLTMAWVVLAFNAEASAATPAQGAPAGE